VSVIWQALWRIEQLLQLSHLMVDSSLLRPREVGESRGGNSATSTRIQAATYRHSYLTDGLGKREHACL
jgi:hypothetical protein